MTSLQHPHREKRDLAQFVVDAPRGAVRLLIGVDAAALQTAIAPTGLLTRPVYALDLAQDLSVEAIVEQAIDATARAVSRLWPFLWDGEDFSDMREDPLARTALPTRLRTLASRAPLLSQNWAGAAILRLVSGRAPRLRAAAREVEFAQLCYAISPKGLILAAPFDPDAEPHAFIRAMEWMAATAGATILILAPTAPPVDPPFDRLLFGARTVALSQRRGRCASEAIAPPPSADENPTLLAAPPVIGRPHPLSAVEQKMAAMITKDGELRFLFSWNQFVSGLSGPRAKVDLVWSDGRVVIEFDGAEHARAKYRADRHRDYELLRAGYLVLRLVNEEVLEDAGRSLEKIRDVVRLRRREQGRSE